jgi:hypothetical protein
MLQLTVEGQRVIDDLARRHGISADAAGTLLRAVVAGQGSMAQFDHPELGGSGQWMRGGMTMVGDMFNHGLKAKVDAVCMELALLIGEHMSTLAGGGQMQSQGGASQASGVSLFVPAGGGRGGNWWPDALGMPASTGQQNSVRYAYFPMKQRLAIDLNGRVEVYDTGDHAITGFSQQQSGDASLTFTSQHGVVALSSLARIEDGAVAPRQPEDRAAAEESTVPLQTSRAPQVETPAAVPERPSPGPAPSAQPPDGDVFTLIERLADLHAKGILSDEEFTQKKTELLKRV